MHRSSRAVLLLASTVAAGCSFFRGIGLAPGEQDHAAVKAVPANDEAAHVVVQHVLIAFEGSRISGATRTKDEARALALRVLEDAKSGRDFDELVRLYTDDRSPDGRVALANWGVVPEANESERRKMVRGFGATAFRLAVGEVGLLEYDANASPFGWHVVKRLK